MSFLAGFLLATIIVFFFTVYEMDKIKGAKRKIQRRKIICLLYKAIQTRNVS